ncbi:MAG TPA: molybdopterin cofactor-binding domain-containing protein [Pseudonocardia sp.]|nr:molybdopterin cofactor-binding domain-containing protein [Pseudonocardia sp.]
MTDSGWPGRSAGRIDAPAKARGEHRYPSDHRPAGALWVRPVRAPLVHATISRVDTEAARAVPGVVGVFTAADLPGCNGFGLISPDQPVLCDRVVRCAGDLVAVVAAETDRSARLASGLVEVDALPLPLLTDPELALRADAPKIWPGGNLCAELLLGHGDVATGFAEADVVLEYAYRTGWQEHAFLETEAGVSYLDEDGRLTVCAGGQNPFSDRRQICAALDLPATDVRVLHPMMGGAFGGKEDISVQIVLALVTRLTGRPARFTLDRAESIAYGVKRHPFQVRYRVGATAAGELTALDAELLADTGAYLTLGPGVLGLAAEHTGGPYRYRHARIAATAVYTNNGNASAFRGFGNPQVTTGIEQVIDQLAGRLGLDPLLLRRRNTLRPGGRAAAGFAVRHGVELAGVLDSAAAGRLLAEAADWKAAARPWKRRGVGTASAWQGYGLGAGVESGAEVSAERTAAGRYLVTVSCPDLGEGNHTAFAQLAAAELGCPVGQVDVSAGDSDGPDSDATNASRTVFAVGNAVAGACARLAAEPGPARVAHTYRPELPEAHIVGMPHIGYTPAVLVLGVEVDVLTGEVDVLRLEHHVDPGRAVNPAGVRGQSEGAILQGLGFALLEEHQLMGGRVRNDRFANYLIPGITELPERLETVLVCTPDPANPLGVRGVGEIGITPVAAAVGNALCDAIGHRFDRFPITPDAVLAALDGAGGVDD